MSVDPTGRQGTIQPPSPSGGCGSGGRKQTCVGLTVGGGAAGPYGGGAAGIGALLCDNGCTQTLVVFHYECMCFGLYVGGGLSITGCAADAISCLPGGGMVSGGLPPFSLDYSFGNGFRCGSAGIPPGQAVGGMVCDCTGGILYTRTIRWPFSWALF